MHPATLLVRPACKHDLDAIYQLVTNLGSSTLTSLPQNKAALSKIIEHSENSFNEILAVKTRKYFLVLEKIDNAGVNIIGTSGIILHAGSSGPFYNYKISTITQNSANLNKNFNHKILRLVNDYQDCAELSSLLVDPQHRGVKSGSLIARSRYLFLAEMKDIFPAQLIAEIRGVADVDGISPVWEALGRKFFAMEFNEADHLTTVHGKQFISDLMPREAIYLNLLPMSAQVALGKTHKDARSVAYMLQNEGFSYRDYVDIFDGGPVYEAQIKDLKTINNSKCGIIQDIDLVLEDSRQAMICCMEPEFRCTIGYVMEVTDVSFIVDPTAASLLEVKIGSNIRLTYI